MDNAIKDIIIWLRGFLKTFYHSIFKPRFFFNTIYFKRDNNYINPLIYLTICLIFILSVNITITKYSLAFEKHNEKYIESVNNFLFGGNFLTQILYTLPLAFLLFVIIKLIGEFLFKGQVLKNIFINLGVYWMASFSFLYALLFLIIRLNINAYVSNRFKSDVGFLAKDESHFPFFSYFLYYIQLLGYFIPALVILNFFKRIEKQTIKLLLLSVLSGSSVFLINRMIDAELHLINYLKGDEVEIHSSLTSKIDPVTFKVAFMNDSTLIYSGKIYIKNKSNNEFRIFNYKCLLLSVDTAEIRIDRNCTANFKLLDSLEGNAYPVKRQDRNDDETFTIQPNEILPVNISFTMKYQPFTYCMTMLNFNTELYYAYVDEDFLLKSSQQLSTYIEWYNECKTSDSITKPCIESLYRIIQTTGTYKEIINKLESKKKRKKRYTYKLVFGGVTNNRNSIGSCYLRYEFSIIEGFHNDIEDVANFSFDSKERTLSIYDESIGHLRNIKFDRNLLKKYDDECNKTFKSQYYLE